MNVGYLQFAPVFGQVQANVAKVRNMLDNSTADVMVLPELFNTGYYFSNIEEVASVAEKIPDGFTCRQLTETAKQWRMHIVAGILEEDEGKYYNSAVLIGEEGYIDHYRKIHLFNEEKNFFTPGDRPFRVYDTGKAKIGIMICFDWIFPESTRILSLLGAEVICHPANLIMPYCPKVMPSRCFENRVFAITANRTGSETREGKTISFIGQSQIVNPEGKIIKRAGADGDALEIVFINPAEARNKKIDTYNDLFKDRRPEMYRALTQSVRELETVEHVDAKTSMSVDKYGLI